MTLTIFSLELLMRCTRCVVLVALPLRGRARLKGWRSIPLMAALMILFAAASLIILHLLPQNTYTRFSLALFGIASMFLIGLCIFKTSPLPLLFLAWLQTAYDDCLRLFVRVVLLLTSDAYTPLQYTVFLLFLTIFTVPAMYLLARSFAQPTVDRREHQPFWRIAWLLPTLNYVIFRLAVFPGYFSADTRAESPWMLILLLWPVVTLIIYLVILKLLRNTTRHFALEIQLQLNGQMLQLQELRFAQLADDAAQARVVRHDMRHHLLVIQGLLSAGQVEEANHYLTNLRQTTPR